MAAPETSPWRQSYDAVEREIAPRVDALVRSEGFAVAVGLAARAQRLVQDGASRSSRRLLHRLNLPAGSDVTRILNEIGQLKRQVRELTAQLEEARTAVAERPPLVAAGTPSGAANRSAAGVAKRSAGGPAKRAARSAPRKAG